MPSLEFWLIQVAACAHLLVVEGLLANSLGVCDRILTLCHGLPLVEEVLTILHEVNLLKEQV